MSNGKVPRQNLEPLAITCTSADCDEGLHCFKKGRSMSEMERGCCRYCGADLVDWQRVHKRDVNDAAFVFKSLKYELVRHHFWHKPIDARTENHALRKGRLGLREAARHRLTKCVAPKRPAYDGRQTPWDGNIVHYAQHATACCCRSCVDYWHGIPKGVQLDEEQLDYFVELIIMYIDDRMPQLTEEGEYVPPIRRH